MLTTDFPQGSPCWLDLGSPDPAAAAAFYGAVFGWTFQALGPEAGGYGFLQADGRTVAAVGALTEEGAQSAWTTYFRTPDAEATARAVRAAGGEVRVEPFDVMQAGRMAQLTDPQGARFAVWQSGTTIGLDAVSTDNALVWAELHTPDQEAGAAFYATVFGWRSEKFPAPGMSYLVLSPPTATSRPPPSAASRRSWPRPNRRPGRRTSRPGWWTSWSAGRSGPAARC